MALRERWSSFLPFALAAILGACAGPSPSSLSPLVRPPTAPMGRVALTFAQVSQAPVAQRHLLYALADLDRIVLSLRDEEDAPTFVYTLWRQGSDYAPASPDPTIEDLFDPTAGNTFTKTVTTPPIPIGAYTLQATAYVGDPGSNPPDVGASSPVPVLVTGSPAPTPVSISLQLSDGSP